MEHAFTVRWGMADKDVMKFIDKFIRTVEIVLRPSPSSGEAEDMNIDKQNTPPDDRDAEVDEATPEHESVLSGLGGLGTETGANGEAKTNKATTRP